MTDTITQIKALRPCPFCGDEGWMHSDSTIFARHMDGRGAVGHRIECEGKCHAMTCWWHSKQEAIDHWNMRVNHSDELIERVERAEAALADIIGKDTYIDASIQGSRTTFCGQFAVIARAALSRADQNND